MMNPPVNRGSVDPFAHAPLYNRRLPIFNSSFSESDTTSSQVMSKLNGLPIWFHPFDSEIENGFPIPTSAVLPAPVSIVFASEEMNQYPSPTVMLPVCSLVAPPL